MRKTLVVLFVGLCASLPLSSSVTTFAEDPTTAPATRGTLQEQITAAEEELRAAKKKESEAYTAYSTVAQDLGAKTGIAQLRNDTLLSEIQKASEAIAPLKLESVAAEARANALAKFYATYSEQAKLAARSDEIAAELQKVVEAREKQLATLSQLNKNGQSSSADLYSAQAALAEAKAKVAERRREAATSAGGDELAGLKKEDIKLSLDAAERSARIQYLTQRLELLNKSMQTLEEARVEHRLDDAEQNLQRAQERLKRLRD